MDSSDTGDFVKYHRLHNKENKEWAPYDKILINAIKNRPCLWNVTLPPGQRNVEAVAKAWHGVAIELQRKFPLLQIRKRWRNLRNSYRKDWNKINSLSDDRKDTPSFRYYEYMSFIDESIISIPGTKRKHIKLETSIDKNVNYERTASPSYISENFVEYIDEPHDINNMESYDNDTIVTDQFDNSHAESAPNKLSEETIVHVIGNNTKTQDAVDGFLLQLGEIMRNLPYRNRRLLQNRIMEVAYEVELEAGIF